MGSHKMAKQKEKFDPSKTSTLYDLYFSEWELSEDMAQPSLHVIQSGKHIPKFSDKETATDYAFRLSMAVPLDMCQDAIRIRLSNLWRVPVKREFDESPFAAIIGQFVTDADNMGRSLDTIMREAAEAMYTTGGDLVVQMTEGTGEPVVTQADVTSQGLRAYVLLFNVKDRVDWACNGARQFSWARYSLGSVPQADEKEDAPGESLYLTVTTDEWRLHRVKKDKDAHGNEITEVKTTSGQHKLGFCPITKMYYSESKRTGEGGVPISLIARAAMVAKVAMNLKSQADADLIAAIPRWMFTGTEDPPDSFGPGAMYATNDAGAKLMVVQGDVEHIKEKREWLMMYLLEILRLLKFRGGMGDTTGNQASGIKLALEMTDLHTELTQVAEMMEETELELVRQAVMMQTGKDIPKQDAAETLGYSVRYNRDFVLEGVRELLENIERYVDKAGELAGEVPTILKELLRQLKNRIVRKGTEADKQIEAEIEGAEFGLQTGVDVEPAPTPSNTKEGTPAEAPDKGGK